MATDYCWDITNEKQWLCLTMAVPKLCCVAIFHILHISSSAVVVWNKQREPAINSINRETNGDFFFSGSKKLNHTCSVTLERQDQQRKTKKHVLQNIQVNYIWALTLNIRAHARKPKRSYFLHSKHTGSSTLGVLLVLDTTMQLYWPCYKGFILRYSC